MTDRKKTPDIMSDLLGGSAPEPTIKPEYHNTGIPVDHKAIKPERKPAVKPIPASTWRDKVKAKEEEAPGAKIKATFYISSAIVDRLEEGWSELRKISPKDKRPEISKSWIVETALQEILEELDSKQITSLLAKKASQIRQAKK